MEIVLFGLATNILTRLSGKLKLSKTYVSVLLCLIGGTAYYIMTNYYSVEWKQLVIFVSGAYATSQFVYNLILKKWDTLKKLGINVKI